MATKKGEARTVKATETAFAIIEKLDELEKAGISEVADELSIAKSTAHKHLKTLEKCEYVVREGEKYRLGLKHLKYGRHVLSEVDIAEKSQPVIDHLAEETGEAIWTAIEEHGQAVYVNRALGERAVPSRGGIGERVDLHSSAIGKALLANLPPERIDEVLERRGLPKMTQDTITDREELMEELEKIRERGFAINDNESLQGLRAVASPIIHEDELKGAIAVVGTANRMKGEYFTEEIPDLVLSAANEIELKLAYS